jgi:hypothetical protein
MEGKLNLYEHGHQVELHTLKNVVQTPPNGPFGHEGLLREVVIQHNGMQQGLHLVEVPTFIPITQMHDFIIGAEDKDGGQRHFLCKKRIIHLDNDLQ